MRRGKKYIKRAFITVIILALVLTNVKVLDYLYWSTDDDWERVLWHNFYNKPEVQELYVGSSHVFNSVNTILLEQDTGKACFNLASSSQRLIDSYFLLKEAERTGKKPETVYLDLCYLLSTPDHNDLDPAAKGEALGWHFRNTDYMSFSGNRLKYIYSATDIEQWPDAFIPFVRIRDKFGDDGYVQGVINKKSARDYIDHKFRQEREDGRFVIEYRDNGYYYTTRILSEDELNYRRARTLKEEPLGETSELYLRKIAEYCGDRNIRLVLFSAPLWQLMTMSDGDYDNYVECVKKIAGEYNIPYYDLNLIKEQYFPPDDRSLFMNMEHLNADGAELLEPIFKKLIEQDGNISYDEYFYGSYREKLENEKPYIYGICPETDEDTDPDKIKYHIVASGSNLEYGVRLAAEDESESRDIDFTENDSFEAEKDKSYICHIEIRDKDQKKIVGSVEIKL